LGRLDGQEAGAQEALAEARLAEDPIRIVRTLITLGNWMSGDRTPAYAEAAELAEAAGYKWGAATAWNSLADAHWTAGRTDETMNAIVRSQEASKRMGDHAGVATALSVRGEYELNLGRIGDGVAHLGEAVDPLRATPGVRLLMSIALTGQAMGRALDGRP